MQIQCLKESMEKTKQGGSASCLDLSDTMRATQHGGSFQIGTSLISSSCVTKLCSDFSNRIFPLCSGRTIACIILETPGVPWLPTPRKYPIPSTTSLIDNLCFRYPKKFIWSTPVPLCNLIQDANEEGICLFWAGCRRTVAWPCGLGSLLKGDS